MTAADQFANELRARLRMKLEAIGSTIVSRVPGTQWHVEVPTSRIYDFVAMLILTSATDPQTELVTLSLESRDIASGAWVIDATDRESLPITDDIESLEEQLLIDMSNVSKATADIEATLDAWVNRITRELAP